jgi:hypothetical protein
MPPGLVVFLVIVVFAARLPCGLVGAAGLYKANAVELVGRSHYNHGSYNAGVLEGPIP